MDQKRVNINLNWVLWWFEKSLEKVIKEENLNLLEIIEINLQHLRTGIKQNKLEGSNRYSKRILWWISGSSLLSSTLIPIKVTWMYNKTKWSRTLSQRVRLILEIDFIIVVICSIKKLMERRP